VWHPRVDPVHHNTNDDGTNKRSVFKRHSEHLTRGETHEEGLDDRRAVVVGIALGSGPGGRRRRGQRCRHRNRCGRNGQRTKRHSNYWHQQHNRTGWKHDHDHARPVGHGWQHVGSGRPERQHDHDYAGRGHSEHDRPERRSGGFQHDSELQHQRREHWHAGTAHHDS
jgi:hypothetical protein